MRGIGKRFPGVVALHDVDLEVGRGEVLGLIGENGAGKSTLMKILSGAYQADAGEIVVAGERIARPSPQRMLELGIAVIYQEMMLAPHLTVAENLFLGRLPTNRFGLVDWRRPGARSVETMARLGFKVDPGARLDRSERRAAADGRDRQRAVAQRPPGHPRRAVGGARRRRAREAVRRHPPSRGAKASASSTSRTGCRRCSRICDRVTVLRDGAVVGTRRSARSIRRR